MIFNLRGSMNETEINEIEGHTDGTDERGQFARVFWAWSHEEPTFHFVRLRDVTGIYPVKGLRDLLDAAAGAPIPIKISGRRGDRRGGEEITEVITIPHSYVLFHQEMVETELAKMQG